jgi:hypothetical protein
VDFAFEVVAPPARVSLTRLTSWTTSAMEVDTSGSVCRTPRFLLAEDKTALLVDGFGSGFFDDDGFNGFGDDNDEA